MSEVKKQKGIFKEVVLPIILGILAFILVLSAIASVRCIKSGHTGVKLYFGKVQQTTLNSGINFVNPIGLSIVQMNNKISRADTDIIGASKDLQTITGSISINYNLEPESSASMYLKVGTGYEDIIIKPAIQESTKAIISKYTAEELITKRSQVSSEMKDALEEKIATYGLTIKEFNILNLNFSDEFNAAIEAKQTAQQQALKAQQDLARIKIEAEQKVTQAEADAKAYELKSKEITDNMVLMEFINKWDGKLPTVASSNSNILDVSEMLKNKTAQK